MEKEKRNKPGRPRAKNSTSSLNSYGLKKDEDDLFLAACSNLDLSAAQVVRALIRQFLKEGGAMPRYSTSKYGS